MIKLLLISLYSLSLFSESQIIIKKFDWKIYKTRHFDIYFYDDSKMLVDYASKVIELAYDKASKELNPKLDKRIPFFLFASENDMKQNSITEVGDGTGGLTEPYKDRLMVYNDGSKRWLRDVIFHEFGHEAQFSVLVDGWWESPRILKTIIYPMWMMEGMAENMTSDWDLSMEDLYVRDYFIDNKLPPLEKLYGFGHLKPHQTTLGYKTGSAAMRFLFLEYGKDKPSLMLYYFRDAYDINYVFKKLIGTDLDGFDKRFRKYLEFKYFNQIKDENLSDAEIYGRRITQPIDDIPFFNTSPVFINKNKIAYISTINGHPPSIVIEELDNKTKKVLNYDLWDIDNILYSRFTLPVKSLSLSSDKRYLVFSAQKNNREYLCIYDVKEEKSKKVLIDGFEQARQFSFSKDDRKILFVGMKKGVNKIYEFDFNLSLKEKVIKENEINLIVDGDEDKLSPQYSTDGGIFYICESGDMDDIKNNLCYYKDGVIKKYKFKMDLNDFYYDFSNNRIYFISDYKNIYNLYSYSIDDSKLYKNTSVIGGIFTPYYENGDILFSYFRHQNINIFASSEKELNYQELKDSVSVEEMVKDNRNVLNKCNLDFTDYKFKASTDLFFPALFFASPGGLFTFLYYQASDYLGRHNLGAYLNYNSAYPYTNFNLTYFYNRYRTKFVEDLSYFSAYKIDEDSVDERDRRYFRSLTGISYPFDRYKSGGIYFYYKNDREIYKYSQDYYEKKRGISLSYLDNRLNGLYLTATHGYLFSTNISYLDHIACGNVRYNSISSDYIRYFPISRKSTLVNRVFTGFSNGRDNPQFSYGGVGGLRGFIDNSSNEDKNVFVYNLESRLCLFYMDYYMSYFFPDFYFKALYFKIFSDNAYGWSRSFKPEIGSVKNSIGFGFNIHTFVLQRYQMVLSLDWSFNTRTGSNVMYFYLGPLF